MFIDSIRFIPFESVEGVNVENASVRPTEKYYLVTNYSTRILYIYSKSGAFIKQLNFKSLDDLYPKYNAKTNQLIFFGDNRNYTLTSKDRIKISLDWSNTRNLKYFKKYVVDLNDTSFTVRKSKPDKYDLTGADPFLEGRYIQTKIATSKLYPDSLGHEVNIYANGQLLKSYFPYNRITEPRFLFTEEEVSVSSSDTPYISYLTRPYCDTIYKLVNDSLYAACQLVMPLENSLPPSFFTVPFNSKNEKENFKRNNGWVFHQAYGFYETPRFIYLSIGFFTRFETFVYDKQTNTAYNASKIKADAKQYNLSLLSQNIQRVGNKIYKLLKADNLISFFKQNPGIEIPRELAVFLQNNPDKNTPVVVECKLKD